MTAPGFENEYAQPERPRRSNHGSTVAMLTTGFVGGCIAAALVWLVIPVAALTVALAGAGSTIGIPLARIAVLVLVTALSVGIASRRTHAGSRRRWMLLGGLPLAGVVFVVTAETYGHWTSGLDEPPLHLLLILLTAYAAARPAPPVTSATPAAPGMDEESA